MNKFWFAPMFVAAMALSATSAGAVTVDSETILEGGQTSSINTSITGEDVSIEFDFTDVPFTAFVEFTVVFDSSLFLTSFIQPDLQGASGYSLDLLGDPDTRLTTEASACATAPSPVGGSCNLITTSSSSSENELFALAAGSSYRLGFRETGEPNQGTAVFDVIAATPVPLPAGLVLILSGLGLLGFVSRRKAT